MLLLPLLLIAIGRCSSELLAAAQLTCSCHLTSTALLAHPNPLPTSPCYVLPPRLEVPAVEEGEPEFAAMLFYDEITRGDAFMCEWRCC